MDNSKALIGCGHEARFWTVKEGQESAIHLSSEAAAAWIKPQLVEKLVAHGLLGFWQMLIYGRLVTKNTTPYL